MVNFMHFCVIAILHKQVAKPPPQEPRKPLAGTRKKPRRSGTIGSDLSSVADVGLASLSKYDDPFQHSLPGIRLTTMNGALKAEVKDQRDRQPFLEVLLSNLVSSADRRIF